MAFINLCYVHVVSFEKLSQLQIISLAATYK